MIIEVINKIYSHMEDDISRRLFIARLNASVTFDDSYIIDCPDEYKTLNPEILSFKNELSDNKGLRTVIFGAGFNGRYFAYQLLKKNVTAFIDNHVRSRYDELNGLPIYTPEEYFKSHDSVNTRFLISVSDRSVSRTMFEQLRKYNVPADRIITAPDDYRNNICQYFDVFAPEAHETFVDCGAYDGSTAFRFAGWCGTKGYDKILCFEPDIISYKNTESNCSKLADCKLFPYGVSDKEGEVAFAECGREDSHITTEDVGVKQERKVKTVRLDDVIGTERVTFIKMDIEGEEYKALTGAREIITKQKPRLAISVYHRNDDIIQIPDLLLEMVPEYKFIIRHYSLLNNETILYAYT